MFPYFETLLEHLTRGDAFVRESFGDHVHWGYWENPPTAPISPAEFRQAAELLLERMLRTAGMRGGLEVLDVGCGLGGTIGFLNEHYSGCNIVGLNIAENQLQIANRRMPTKNRNSIGFVRSDACSLPFKEPCFDLILCVESIFHFKDRKEFLQGCGRALKPNGMLVISDFVPVQYFGKLFNYVEENTRLAGSMYGHINVDISISEYRALARSSGMQCISIDDITRNTLPTYRFLREHLHRTEKRGIYTRATRLVEVISRMRLLRYTILAFRKADPGQSG